MSAEKVKELADYLNSFRQDDYLDIEAAELMLSMQSRIEALEKDCCQLIDERDERDEVIDALMSQVLGSDCKEWSSAYGFNDAVVDVECRMKELEKDAARYRWLTKQAWFQTSFDRFDPDDGGMQGKFESECARIIDAAMQSEKGGV